MKDIKELLYEASKNENSTNNDQINEGGLLFAEEKFITFKYKGKTIKWDDLEVEWTDGRKDHKGSFSEFIDNFIDQCSRVFR